MLKLNLLSSKDPKTRLLWEKEAEEIDEFSHLMIFGITLVILISSFHIQKDLRYAVIGLSFSVLLSIFTGFVEGSYKTALWMSKGWYYLFQKTRKPIRRNIEFTKKTLAAL